MPGAHAGICRVPFTAGGRTGLPQVRGLREAGSLLVVQARVMRGLSLAAALQQALPLGVHLLLDLVNDMLKGWGKEMAKAALHL